MEDKLVNILEGLTLEENFDVILQGTLDSEDDYPDNFFSYWCWDNARDSFYNNKNSRNILSYQISVYSTDRSVLLKMTKQAIEELEKNDFIIEDDGTDASSNNKTHTSKIFDVYYINKKED